MLGERGKLEGGESNIRLIKGAAYMRERERESIRLISEKLCVQEPPLCVLPSYLKSAAGCECQCQPRVQRRQHLELDSKCAPPINMSPSPAIMICGNRRQFKESVDTLHYCVMCAYRRFRMQTPQNAALPSSPSIT